MELYKLEHGRHLFGFRVESFPQGIKEAFNALMKLIGDDGQRAYYGLSHFDEQQNILYYVTVEEANASEAEKYNCEKYIIDEGNYMTITVHDWMKKTDTIKDVFHELMLDTRADLTTSCIEWYKTDEEMMCMLKMKADQS